MWASVMTQIKDERPTILHFGCQAEDEVGLYFFKQTVKSQKMAVFIKAWNQHAGTRGLHEIRLIIVNTCESHALTETLSEYVDFAIGHKEPLQDVNAINFSYCLFDSLSDGIPLLSSFEMTKTCTPYGYHLYAKRNPTEFRLVETMARGGGDNAAHTRKRMLLGLGPRGPQGPRSREVVNSAGNMRTGVPRMQTVSM